MAPNGVFRHPAPSPRSLYKGRLPWTHRGLTLLDHIVPSLPTPYDKEYIQYIQCVFVVEILIFSHKSNII